MQTIIAVIARKGGVGKTTSVYNLGAAMAVLGKRVLLIDLDPQATLTDSLQLATRSSASTLFAEDCLPLESLIVPTAFKGLSILPGSPGLDRHNVPADFGGRLFVLRDFLAGLEGFDRVLIDAPPNLYLLSMAALVSADYVVIPLKADPSGLASIPPVLQVVQGVQAGPNSGIQVLGLLRTMYKRRGALHGAYSTLIGKQHPGLLMEGFLPESAMFPEADMAKTPLPFYKVRSEAAKACGRIVEEMELRIKDFVARAA